MQTFLYLYSPTMMFLKFQTSYFSEQNINHFHSHVCLAEWGSHMATKWRASEGLVFPAAVKRWDPGTIAQRLKEPGKGMPESITLNSVVKSSLRGRSSICLNFLLYHVLYPVIPFHPHHSLVLSSLGFMLRWPIATYWPLGDGAVTQTQVLWPQSLGSLNHCAMVGPGAKCLHLRYCLHPQRVRSSAEGQYEHR